MINIQVDIVPRLYSEGFDHNKLFKLTVLDTPVEFPDISARLSSLGCDSTSEIELISDHQNLTDSSLSLLLSRVIAHFDGFTSRPRFTLIDLTGNSLTDLSVESICSVIELLRPECVSLSRNFLTHVGMIKIFNKLHQVNNTSAYPRCFRVASNFINITKVSCLLRETEALICFCPGERLNNSELCQLNANLSQTVIHLPRFMVQRLSPCESLKAKDLVEYSRNAWVCSLENLDPTHHAVKSLLDVMRKVSDVPALIDEGKSIKIVQRESVNSSAPASSLIEGNLRIYPFQRDSFCCGLDMTAGSQGLTVRRKCALYDQPSVAVADVIVSIAGVTLAGFSPMIQRHIFMENLRDKVSVIIRRDPSLASSVSRAPSAVIDRRLCISALLEGTQGSWSKISDKFLFLSDELKTLLERDNLKVTLSNDATLRTFMHLSGSLGVVDVATDRLSHMIQFLAASL